MKYLILGAGPAGLTFANRLKQLGIKDFIVLEQEMEAGGLCRSTEVDGAPFDIGGGHFLDVRRPEVTHFLFEFMPEDEWNLYERDSKIFINGQLISHPLEANIWQMRIEEQVEYLKSIAMAGCNQGKDKPSKFVDWIYWKLGKRIAEDYMIPYNQKMFGDELNCLGTYWMDKLPNVSFEETLLSCLTKKAYGKQPGHAKFYYPKRYGYGELWHRMAEELEDNIEYGRHVCGMDFSSGKVWTEDGSKYYADRIINTIPWTNLLELDGISDELRDGLKQLKYSSIETEYFNGHLDTKAQWIYCPDKQLSYHRILVRHNFCAGGKGYWTETNANRVEKKQKRLYTYMNEYAYPLNTVGKNEFMKKFLNWSSEKGIYGLGRWGEHQHYNSDVTVELALQMADRMEK